MLWASEDLHAVANNPSSTTAAYTELILCSSGKNLVMFWIKKIEFLFDIAASPPSKSIICFNDMKHAW